jgi:hypothetical protein
MQTFDTADARETGGNGSNETKALAAVVFRNPRLFTIYPPWNDSLLQLFPPPCIQQVMP